VTSDTDASPACPQPFQDGTDLLPYVQLTTIDGHAVLLSATHYLPSSVSPVAVPADATMLQAGQARMHCFSGLSPNTLVSCAGSSTFRIREAPAGNHAPSR